MPPIEKLKEDLVSLEADQSALLEGTWDQSAFDANQASIATINEKIEAVSKASYKPTAVEQSAPVIHEPVTPNFDTSSHVTGIGEQGAIVPGWHADPKKGYKGEFVAGQIMQDLIAGSIHGPSQVSTEFGQYCSYLTGMEQTSGVTSTLTNGIEIVPELLPKVPQYGPRVFGLEQMIKETSSKGIVEYYKNEQTYQVNGLIAAWSEEGETMTATRDGMTKGHLELDPLYVFASLTKEIQRDAPLLESRYIQKAPGVMQVAVWKEILSGNGVGRPLGILNGASTISTTRTTSSRIKFEDLALMEARFMAGGTTAGFYVCSQTVLPQLMQIVDGRGAYLWKSNANDGITGSAVSGFLFGRPVIISEDCETLGTSGDFVLIDPAGYLLVEQSRGVEYNTSPHFYFNTNKMALRWDTAIGGMPYFAAAYTPRKGSTLSFFVNVAT